MSVNTYGSVVRKKILFFIMIGFTVLVTINLVNMQILDNPSYEKKSAENSIKKITLDAPRGIFYDRYYNVVVSNKPSFTLRITPSGYDNSNDILIEKVIGSRSGFIQAVLDENKHLSRYTPLRVQKDVKFDFISWYEENSNKLPGVDYAVELQRDYSFGINGAHMLGYIKEISADQLKRKKDDDYVAGDFIGFNGLEKQYEEYLRGQKGYNLFLVDSRQQPIGRYKDGEDDEAPVKGHDLVLSIDNKTQQVAEASFINKRGALVAIEPATGEILAFVSAPNYNLSDFDAVTTYNIWQKLNADSQKPLFNRASMSVNSPGSTFKIMAALAGLQEGVITPDTRIRCTGGLYYGDRFFSCMHVHGRVNLIEAIEKSCNSYFYDLILKIDLDKWAEYSRRFGFGSKTNIDIGEEARGLVPDSEYYNRVIGKGKWAKGWTISLGIGQGELGVTVSQLAKYVSLVANNGKSKEPHFVRGYIDNNTKELVMFDFESIDVEVPQKYFDLVKQGMFLVVNGEGSARNIKSSKVEIAGKTGTAQNPHGDEHALFIAFAPYDNPQIAVAVLVENAGFGSTYAAPIARDVILTYLNNKEINLNKNKIALKR